MITYEFKIKTRHTLVQKFHQHLGVTRLVYNLARETREESWKKGKSLSKFDIINQLPELKEAFTFMKDVHAQTLQGVVERLDNSYQKYFRDLKSGVIQKGKQDYIRKKLSTGQELNFNKLKEFGKPKWARKKDWSSIEFKQSAIKYEGKNKLKLSKIGEIKFFKSRDIQGTIKIVRILKKADGWYLQVVTDHNRQLCDNQAEVGIDLGLSYLIVTSDGEYVENIKTLKKYLAQLRIENRSLDRKKKFGKNFYKQVLKLQKLHLKIARVRKDYLHKVTTALSKKYSTIYCEDLNISDMVQDKSYAREISDVAWSTLLQMLDYKSNLIKVDPKYSSQECSECSHVSKQNRASQSQFKCVSCGHKQNADLNASINIKKRGQALLGVNVGF